MRPLGGPLDATKSQWQPTTYAHDPNPPLPLETVTFGHACERTLGNLTARRTLGNLTAARTLGNTTPTRTLACLED